MKACEIYEMARRQWGDAQKLAAIEELNEAAAAIARWSNGKMNEDQVCEELADAAIMIEQMMLHFGAERVNLWKQKKLLRLADRLGMLDPPVPASGAV